MEVMQKIEQLEEAQRMVLEAARLVREALSDHPLGSLADAYLIPSLEADAGNNGDRFQQNPGNIEGLITKLHKEL